MKIRTVVLVTAVVLAAAYAGATYHYSARSEDTALQWTQRMARAAPFGKASQDYQRGFLKSTQDIVFTIPLPGAAGKSTAITLRNVIHHGPLPGFRDVGVARIEHSFVFDEAAAKELAKAFGDAPPLTAVTHIDFSGEGYTEVKGAPASYAQSDGKFTWQGLSGKIRFTRGMSSYSGELAAPGVSVTSKDGGGASLEAMSLKMDQVRMANTENVYLGTMSLRAQSLTLTKGGKPEFEMKGFAMSAEATSKEPEFLDVGVRFGAEEFATVPFSGSRLEYAVSARHLHAPSLDKLNLAMQQARQSTGGQDPAAMLQVFQAHGLALLQRDPVIAIDRLGFANKDGETNLTGTVRLVGVTDADMANPMGLLAKVDLQATLKVAEAFLRTIMLEAPLKAMRAQGREPTAQEIAQLAAQQRVVYDAKIGELVSSGHVVREGNVITARFSFKDGQLLMNDKPFGAAPAPPR
jgi:uncharacterized protein YdgA (DUF945 family)